MKKFILVGLLALLILSFVFPLIFSAALVTAAIFSLLIACAATGWNLFSGYTGYISLGYGTYYGIGGYTLALLCKDWHIPAGYLPFLFLPIVGLVTALFALPIGWISLRVRGHNFVIITIATIFIFQLLAYNLAPLTEGNDGIYFSLPPWKGDFYNIPFYYVALILLLVSLAVSWWIRGSKYGLSLLAMRDDEERARGLGVNTKAYKLTAFAISAFFGGVVGATSLYYIGSIYPTSAFDPTFDILPALMTFTGGVGTLAGPVFGAFLLEPLKEFMILRFGAIGLDLILFGSLLLLLILFLPEGVIPTARRLWKKRQAAGKIITPIATPGAKEESLLVEGSAGGQG